MFLFRSPYRTIVRFYVDASSQGEFYELPVVGGTSLQRFFETLKEYSLCCTFSFSSRSRRCVRGKSEEHVVVLPQRFQMEPRRIHRCK